MGQELSGGFEGNKNGALLGLIEVQRRLSIVALFGFAEVHRRLRGLQNVALFGFIEFSDGFMDSFSCIVGFAGVQRRLQGLLLRLFGFAEIQQRLRGLQTWHCLETRKFSGGFEGNKTWHCLDSCSSATASRFPFRAFVW